MDYKRFDNTIIARIDAGEEIGAQIKAIAARENIALATVSALGAVDKFTVGVFKPGEKKYYANRFEGDYEIVSLTGTLSTMANEIYLHLHMSAGDEQGRVVGGHFNEANVSATCEAIIQIINGRVDRAFDARVGLNLLRL